MSKEPVHKPLTRDSHHRNSAVTREVILNAAGQIFAKSGLEGARTEAIAAAAGVNKALLYYYFKSKEDLYRAVLEEYSVSFNRRALEVLSAKGSARSILLRYIDVHFEFIQATPCEGPLYQRLLMTEERSFERLLREYVIPRSERLKALLERGMRSGEFREMDSIHAAISLVALITFYFSFAPVIARVTGHNPHTKENLEKRKKEVVQFIRYALFKDPESKVE
jgi:TetR/AcrR family transcriptional regulator